MERQKLADLNATLFCYFTFTSVIPRLGLQTVTTPMAKRKLDFADIEEMDDNEEIGSASIHGVVTQVSLVKVSKKGNRYFHREVSDGRSTLRFVGFVDKQQKQLKEFLQTRRSVEMRNIQVKASLRDTTKKEILVKGATKICASSQEFDTTGIEFQAAETIIITLKEVSEIEPLTIVSILVKIARCEEPITLGTKQKQDILVCDSTRQGVVQLWEQSIGMLKAGRSYQLTNFRIVEYEEERYIGMCWDGSLVNEIDDLTDAIDISVAEVDHMECVMEAPVIAAVYKLETTFKCLRCGSRTEGGLGEAAARCRNVQCGVLNNTKLCDKFTSAELLMVSNSEKRVLTAYGRDTICELLGGNECSVTEEAILGAPPIGNLTYKNNEIVKIYRS